MRFFPVPMLNGTHYNELRRATTSYGRWSHGSLRGSSFLFDHANAQVSVRIILIPSEADIPGGLCTTMTASDVFDTLDIALKTAGLNQVKVCHRPRLLSDNGPNADGL